MNNENKYIKEVMSGFQKNRGRGSAYCYPPTDFASVVYSVVHSFNTKHPKSSILIVVDAYLTRKKIQDRLIAKGCDLENDYRIKILSVDYIKTKYRYNNALVITVGVNDNIDIIEHLANECKFMLCLITKNVMDTDFITRVRNLIPPIDISVSAVAIKQDNINSPVEEYRIGVALTDDDELLYRKHSDYISTSISVFGDLDAITKCRLGDDRLNISAAEYRDSVARNNGWSTSLDTSIEFHKQIDDNYNPNILLERANNFYNITHARRSLCTDNVSKLDAILNICHDNKDKKILVVSRRGEYCHKIANHINNNSRYHCLEYHDDIEDTMIIDDDTGEYIKYKSGANAGKPKVFKAKAVSTLHLRAFNDSRGNILSMKFASDTKLKTAIDVVIFTSPLLDDVIAFKQRYNDIVFNTVPNKIYTIYCYNTIEQDSLYKRQNNRIITVIDENEDNLFVGE